MSPRLRSGAPRFEALAAGPEIVRVLTTRKRGIEAVRSDQLTELRAVVEHAAATVPLYRDLYGAGAVTIGTFDDLKALPIVDKQTYLALPEPDRRSSITYPGETSVRTSGTTGQPFTVYKTPYARWHNWVHSILMMKAIGVRIRDTQASISRRPRKRTRRGTRHITGTRHQLDPMSPVQELARGLEEIQPDWITAHPHQLVEVGRHLTKPVRPRTVTVFGVTTGPDERAEIEEIFGCSPTDIFGTAETSFFAWQCRHKDLWHITHELVYVEILDDEDNEVPAGDIGHLVLTSLNNLAMPFIRYRVGDSAALATRPCRCGQSLPSLEMIQGRTFDWLVGQDGRRIAPQRLLLGWVLHNHGQLKSVRRYRVIQNADRTARVEIVLQDGFDPSIPACIRAGYELLLGASVEVAVVDQIPLEQTGKFRQFTSAATSEGTPEAH